MNANANTNSNSDGYVVRGRMGIKDSQNDAPSTGNWKNKIPEGNWRTPPPTPPTMQSATAWSYKTSMKGMTTTTPPSQKTAWSNNNNNRRKIINTPPQAPIKKEFVYDMGEFPSLNPTQVVGITNTNTNTNTLSYANIASIPPPPPQKIIPRNLNDDFAIEINENEQNYYNEEEEFTEYKTRESRRWDYDNNDVYEDDYEMDLELGTRYSYN